MPWSPWQDSPLQSQAWDRDITYVNNFDEALGTFPAGLGEGTNIVDSFLLSLWQAGRDDFDDPIPLNGTFDAQQFTLTDEWESVRTWMPAALLSMTEGVDYGVRPDRTGSEDDAYVEYEDDENIPEDTIAGNFLVKTATFSTFGSQPFRIGYDLDTAHFDGETGGWSVGTVFGSGDADTTPQNTSYDDAFPTASLWPNGSSLSFTVALELYGDEPQPLTEEGQRASVQIGSEVSAPGAFLRFREPRWRYWIPRIPPLRQRQRDDGDTTDMRQEKGTPSSLQEGFRVSANNYH